ncbi:MAG: ATP-binding cassette domain-containing protein [Verrucomicrobiales bacterium]|nr:ATP-binding cassette domain-containing protein [Verrucomicrobiales bacterium]
MSHHDIPPSINIPSGLTIGYRATLLKERKETCLAHAENEINLEPGRHLLLARNGRGKTTLLKSVAGIIPTLSGKISSTGTIQFVDEDLRFDGEMTAKQIIKALFKKPQRQFAFEMAEKIELDIEKPYGKLSKGNRQKVGLIVAETRTQCRGNHILLLDEPFSGLDFAAREAVDRVWSENRDGIVRVVCVHPDEPTLKADSAIMIRSGQLEQIEVAGSLDWMETKEALS